MSKIKKQAAVCILAAVLAVPSFAASAEKTDDPVISADTEEMTETDTDTSSDDENIFRDPDSVLSAMLTASENSSYRFCYSEEEDLFALVNKKNGFVWWSSPVNAVCDTKAKGQIKNEIASSMIITGGEPDKRSVFTLRSAKNAKMTYKVTDRGLKVTYRYPSAGFVIPVEYILEDDCIRACIDTSQIEEKKRNESDPQILLSVSVLPNITSAYEDEKGYYIIPDGCGAMISFSSGKTGIREYRGKVYGDDITSVPLVKPAVSEQISLPVYGMIRNDGNGMLAVISEGDANSDIKASISGISKSSYNLCSSSFCLRSTDTYYMDKEPLTVFEKGDILTPEAEMRFYPMYKQDLGYEDAAAVYRNYLISEKNVAGAENKLPLCINLYGGALKKEPVFGIPVTGKKAFTTFEQAADIIGALSEKGAGNMAVTFDNWTNDGINNKVDTGTSPASVLGSGKAFEAMAEKFSSSDVSFYPSVNNVTFESGNGYWEFTDTALRTSGQYSRQLSYNLAYGTQDSTKDPVSLLSYSAVSQMYSDLASGFIKGSVSGLCAGNMTSVLYSDFGKDPHCRNDMMDIVTGGLEKCVSQTGGIYERSANAYAFRFADHISDIPLSSGKYDIFDGDIPFIQTVLHGLIQYSSVPVNGSADPEKIILSAAAAGSGISFDMIYEQASELKDTEYDRLFYANYDYWLDTAVSAQKLLREVLAGTENDYIVSCRKTGEKTVTRYSSGKTVSVDFSTGEITAGGKTCRLSDYI